MQSSAFQQCQESNNNEGGPNCFNFNQCLTQNLPVTQPLEQSSNHPRNNSNSTIEQLVGIFQTILEKNQNVFLKELDTIKESISDQINHLNAKLIKPAV